MRKIKIVTYDNFPYGGAPANYLRYFALSLQEDNLVEVILPTGNFGSKSNINKDKIGKVEKVLFKHLGFKSHPITFVGKFFDNILGSILPFFYFINQRLKGNVDIIVIYNTRLSITTLFLLIKWIIGKKLILILPEFYEKPLNKFSMAYFNWLNFYWGFEYITKFADKFIVLTDFMKNSLLSKGVMEDMILVLPNITDPKVFQVDNVEDFIKDKITIGYCGTPIGKDGIHDLIDSFALLTKKYSETHLLIIGDVISGKSVLPLLKDRVQNHGITNKVTFTGSVPFAKVPQLLNSCQILALTRPSGTFAEAGFPTKLGEYFACKKPVLVTSVGDIEKYFSTDLHAVIVKPNNITSINEGFEKLINNPQLRIKIVKEAYLWLCVNLDYRELGPKINKFLYK